MYLIIQSISSLSTIILKWHQQVSSKTFNGSSCLQTLCVTFYTYAGTRIFLFLLFKINLAVCGGIKPPLTGCSPRRLYEQTLYGAATRIRTLDLLITNQLLYQLSYCGIIWSG